MTKGFGENDFLQYFIVILDNKTLCCIDSIWHKLSQNGERSIIIIWFEPHLNRREFLFKNVIIQNLYLYMP